jgi:hypothetical protein
MDSNDSERRFPPRFSVRTLLIVVTLICTWLGWDVYSRRAHNRQFCDQELDRVLVATHWKATEDTKETKQLAEYWSDELSSRSNCKTAFLMPDGKFTDGAAADSYEQDLLKTWLGTGSPAPGAHSEHVERDTWFGNSFVYYKAIRAKQSCIQCHSMMSARAAASTGMPVPPPLKVDDLMAIGRVQLAK